MGLGTKNRQSQTAGRCRQYLRAEHRAQAALVEEFIMEIEGNSETPDVTRWGQFADTSHSEAAMLQRLETSFQRWLAGEA